MFPAGAAAMFPGQQPVFSPLSPAVRPSRSCVPDAVWSAAARRAFGEMAPNSIDKLGLLPPPRAPGLPGSRLILRKSGRPDLRRGRGGEGGRRCFMRCVRQLLPPPPTPPQPAAGLPASGKYKADQPRRAGVGLGRGAHRIRGNSSGLLAQTQRVAPGTRTPPNGPLTPNPPRGTLPPCHPCEITANLGLRVERSRPHRLYV
jgi:hypothetical protein